MNDKQSIERVADIVGRAQLNAGPDMSRRGFVALVVSAGTATFLLRMEGAHLVRAYADENGDMKYVIYIVSRHQTVVLYKDLSKAAANQAVFGARVTMYSYSTGKTLTGTTNADGAVVFDIRSLSEDVSQTQDGQEYKFWGSLLVECSGYRTYETGLMRIFGGKKVEAPTQPTQDNLPYFRCATIDGYDIQYAKDDYAVFLQSGDAKIPKLHTLKVKLSVPKGAAQSGYTLGVKHGMRNTEGLVDPSISAATSYAVEKAGFKPDADGLINFTVDLIMFAKDKINPKDKKPRPDPCFIVGQFTDVFYRVGTTTCTMKTTLALEDGCIPDEIPEGADNSSRWNTKTLVFEDSPSEGASAKVTIQKGFPLFQDVEISIWHPSFPVKFEFSPFGKALIALGLPVSAEKMWDGKPATGEMWKTTPKGSTKEMYSERYGKAYADYVSRWRGRNRQDGFGKYNTFGNMDVKVFLGVLAEGEWGLVRETAGARTLNWKIEANAIANVLFAFSQSFEIEAGPVPLFLTFELSINGTFGYTANFLTEEAALHGWKFNKDMAGSGMVMDLIFQISVTGGVGVAGVASLGISAYGYIRFYLGMVKPSEDKKFPHFRIGFGLGAGVVLQLLLFKISLSIYHHEWPYAYDNWGGQELNYDEPVRLPLRDEYKMALLNGEKGYYEVDNPQNGLYGLQDVADLMVPVMQEELLALSEFVGTPLPGGPGTPKTYTYSPDDKHTGNRCLSAAVSATGPFGASAENVKILSGVFSDPREQVVTLGDNVYLFRTIVVTHKEGSEEHAVTRIGVSRFASDVWESVTPVDFAYDTGAPIDRSQVFDYDYDVVAKPSRGEIHIFLVGGTRPLEAANETETIDSACRNMVISYVILDENLHVKSQHSYFDYYALTDPTYDHAIMFPRLATDSFGITVASFLHRRVPKGQSFFDGATSHTDFPAVMFFDTESTPITRNGKRIFEAQGGNTEQKSDVQLHMFSSDTLAHGIVLSYTTVDPSRVSSNGDADEASNAVFTSVVVDDGGSASSEQRARFNKVTMVRPWDSQGGGVLKQGKALKNVTIQTGDLGSDINVVLGDSIIPEFEVDQFDISSNGHMIYFVKNMDGTAPATINPDGTTKKGEAVADYQVFASKKIKDNQGVTSLIEPYPFTKLGHLPAHLISYPTSTATAFLYNNITDFDTSKSDMYHVIVPHYKQLKLLNFSAENPYLCPGEEEYLKFTIRNEGNVIVTGFEVTVSDGEKFTAKLPVEVSAAITIPGVDDVQTDKPIPGFSAYDDGFTPCETAFDVPTLKGVFLPGKTKTYRVKLDVPKSWFDDADAGKNEKTLTAYIDPDSIKIADGSQNQDYIELDYVLDSLVSASMFVDNSKDPALATMTYTGGVADGGPETIQANHYIYSTRGGGDGDGGSSSKSPTTGDEPNDLLVLLALALGVGGIGVTTSKLLKEAEEDDVS